MVRILGIDPGSICTGYGIVDNKGSHCAHIANGVIKLKQAALAEKLRYVQEKIMSLIDQYQPQEAVVERVFMNKNADSALKLGQARGAIIAACAMKQLGPFEYTANQVKQAVVGKGHAAKQQVQHMVKILLCLNTVPAVDAADALAIALCHAHTRASTLHMQQIKR